MDTDPPASAAPRPGLRERKKQETRAALSLAAVRLALEHGVENVRVEDIAASVGVSARTFNNYFTSKYEAIAVRHRDRLRQAADELRALPAGEPLWPAVINAVLAAFAGGDQEPSPETQARTRRMLRDPGMRGELLRLAFDQDDALAAVVAERTGTDVHRDLYPGLVSAAVNTAVQVATDRWLHADPPVALVALLRAALEQLPAGLPDPSADRANPGGR